ncbi:hypothetical protein MHIB_21530 [Mycolicibacter hiberniae]|uniref:Uncharacterized protein n=1 Tax=Mycolicibacter hiberniae TaxID=29314 RepID=A0A7I7X3G1_9MYCO|nr:hypothetical protein MHIB_21530 [Mycolicibacter hiberniae]
MTDWAPVICSGATRLPGDLALSEAASGAEAPFAAGGGADRSDDRLVGALTVSSSIPRVQNWWQQKTPASSAAARGLRVGGWKSGNNQRAVGYYEHAVVHSRRR